MVSDATLNVLLAQETVKIIPATMIVQVCGSVIFLQNFFLATVGQSGEVVG